MKKLIVIFCLIANGSMAQNNKLVIDFVNEHYGERVGSGVCSELMYEAWDYVDSVNGFIDSVMTDVKASEVMPGDIIDFDGVVYEGRLIDKHVGIVYHVTGNLLSIAEQNVGVPESVVMYRGEPAPLVKDSHVMFDIFDLSKVVSGKVSFYRL